MLDNILSGLRFVGGSILFGLNQTFDLVEFGLVPILKDIFDLMPSAQIVRMPWIWFIDGNRFDCQGVE
jgi:hypothetical protein